MTQTVLVVLLLAAAAMVLLGWWLVPTWRRWRGARVVNCPETNDPHTVKIDAAHAALTAMGASAEIRLESCTRWPERQDCGQDCLKQIESSPTGCLVKALVSEWYVGKSCAYCGKPIVLEGFADHAPALVSPDGKTVLWKDLRSEQLPAIFKTHRAACWNCHIVESVVRKHPEVVTLRPERDQLIH
ncbi:MAG: hypothetical protein ACHQPI_06810 [Thermoanaerobaculia bacterium]